MAQDTPKIGDTITYRGESGIIIGIFAEKDNWKDCVVWILCGKEHKLAIVGELR